MELQSGVKICDLQVNPPSSKGVKHYAISQLLSSLTILE